MNNFRFYNPTKIYFGSDYEKALMSELKNFKKILLMFGSDRIKKNGLYDKFKKITDEIGIEVFELCDVKENSPLSSVREGIKICKDKDIDLIFAIGGGSVIDAAKGVAVGATTDIDVWDFYSKGIKPQSALPLGVILTVSATGSEASPASVVVNFETNEKRSIRTPLIYPEFSILDPLETHSLSKETTFAGVVDMLSHIMERYFSNTENTDLTNELCEATMRTIIRNSRILLKDLNDKAARAEIMLCGMIAHNGVLGMGREEDWASHRIGHEITAEFGIAHGDTLAMVTPQWLRYVREDHEHIIQRFAKNVFNIDEKDPIKATDLGIKALEDYYEEIGKKIDISNLKVDEKIIDKMAFRALFYNEENSVGNFKKLFKKDIKAIYKNIFKI